jgi:four helix bundle protein
MTPQQLKDRTRRFALDVIRFTRRLPRTDECRLIGRQLFRAGTSVGANYRAACRPRSDFDFVSKLGIVIEEADEAGYWLELLIDAGYVRHSSAEALHDEAEQLTRIFVASRLTARRRLQRQRRPSRNLESRI